MKIIGTTYQGYIVEMDATELEAITERVATEYNNRPSLNIGTVLKAAGAVNHIKQIFAVEAQRKTIAEQLRAAATILEAVPEVLQIPVKNPEILSPPVS